MNLGPKTIFVYKDVKVIFNGLQGFRRGIGAPARSRAGGPRRGFFTY